MTRGGKRQGAGRPVGTTKEPTVMLQRRVKPEWIPIIDNFIKELKNKAKILLLLLFMIALPVNALTLEASVEYTEETARQEAFKNVYKFCPFENTRDFNRSLYVASIETSNVLNIQEFHAKIFKTIPYKVIGVQYKDNPNLIYYYEKTKNGYKGIAIDVIKQDKNNIKAYKYHAKTGELLSVILVVADDEEFIYNANQELIAHWTGENEHINSYKRFIKYFEQ